MGSYSAMAGSTSPTNGDSQIWQTLTAPTGTSILSLWYRNGCPDTVTYDWVTMTLVNHDDNYPGDPTYTLFGDVTVQ